MLKPSTKKELEQVYSDEYILNALSNDNAKASIISHPLVKYYSVFNESNFCGAFMVIQHSKNEIEIHSLLLKEHLKFSRQNGKEIINKCFEDKHITRLTANIYGSLIKAQNYVKKLGFQLEGVKKEAIYKNNNLENINIYGLTRSYYECSR